MTYTIKEVSSGWSGKLNGNHKIRPHFKVKEFSCNDGSETIKMHTKGLDLLEEFRTKVGLPFTIYSAYRTPSYNEKCGGSPKSQHMFGRAYDIAYTDAIRNKFTMEELGKIAIELGFTGIGYYKTFIHVDTRENPNQRGYSFWDFR